jgi:CHAD domain-containing protein
MTEGLLDQDVARLRQDLRTVLRRGAEDLPIVLARLSEARDAAAVEASAALTALGDRFDPEALHGLRTRVRRLRYLAEVDAGLRDEPARAAKGFKALQERLGQIHDAWVLAVWLGRQAALADRRSEPARATAARQVEAAVLERAREHHRSFLSEDPAASLRRALAHFQGRAPAPLRLAR